MMNLTANAVWRCAGAVSPGKTSCNPAYKVSVVQGASNVSDLPDILSLTHCGIDQHEYTSFSLMLRDQLAGPYKMGAQVLVATTSARPWQSKQSTYDHL